MRNWSSPLEGAAIRRMTTCTSTCSPSVPNKWRVPSSTFSVWAESGRANIRAGSEGPSGDSPILRSDRRRTANGISRSWSQRSHPVEINSRSPSTTSMSSGSTISKNRRSVLRWSSAEEPPSSGRTAGLTGKAIPLCAIPTIRTFTGVSPKYHSVRSRTALYGGLCGNSVWRPLRKQPRQKAAKLRKPDLVVGEKTANPPVVRLLLDVGLQDSSNLPEIRRPGLQQSRGKASHELQPGPAGRDDQRERQ